MRLPVMLLCAASVGACTIPTYVEPMPTSPEAWQRRQERIEREDAERRRLCTLAGNNEEARRRTCDAKDDR